MICCFQIDVNAARNQRTQAPVSLPQAISFGDVSMGQQGTATLPIKNHHQDDLTIERIQTSCGCTEPDEESLVLPAGKTINLTFAVDTSRKKGFVSKNATLYFEGYRLPHTVAIQGNVLMSKGHHLNMASKSIFSPECISCHADQGHGLYGGPLYLANCATCHGTNRQGYSAPPLPKMFDRQRWQEAIHSGRGTMEGFAINKHGPLYDDQIESLLNFLNQPLTDVPTQGWSGQDIYMSTCAPCHGEEKNGPIGPELSDRLPNWNKSDVSRVLKHGTSSPMMPSFDRAKGGWLSEADIDMLLDYLFNTSESP
jgi:mono/diheme cytochrome c family protein